MTTFLFIHGGAHGAWCWQPLFGRLEAPALAVDLPGRGRRPADIAQVTPEDWTASVLDEIERHSLKDIVIVAHSLGGLTALRVAAACPERMKHLVFIASPIPEPGQSVAGLMAELARPEPAEGQEGSLGDGLAEATARELLYNAGVTEAQIQWALPQLVPEAMGPYVGPVELGDGWRSVPRTYIRTRRDLGLPPALQARAIQQIAPADVVELDCGHSAMLTHADEIARLLNGLVDDARGQAFRAPDTA